MKKQTMKIICVLTVGSIFLLANGCGSAIWPDDEMVVSEKTTTETEGLFDYKISIDCSPCIRLRSTNDFKVGQTLTFK